MIILFVFSGVMIVVLFYYREEIAKSYSYAGRQAAPVRSVVLPVPQRYREILQKYFPYYQALSADNKRKFEKKVVRFIYGKQFVPRQVDEVTTEAKVLIAASAVQLTFGLPNVYLSFFRTILVYPTDYYSSITKRYHKGEVNPRFGVIVLSWQSFVDGYVYPNDSKNLGLHEMAHALRFESLIRSEDYPPFEAQLLDQFDAFAQKICSDPEFTNQTFFRPYACTDEHEFFSVAVENFFERSELFKAEVPELYGILVRLLGQDPILLKVHA